MSFAWLARTTPLAGMAPISRRLIVGMRQWVCASKAGPAQHDVLARQLGCGRTAAHFHLLIEEIGQAWPDPFCLAPPCCRQSSHDESMIAAMMGAAAMNDRPGFDRLCVEMLGGDVRERLFLSLAMLAGLLGRSPAAAGESH